MDLKIGILTFHTADNYGAVLQAYALKEFISSKYSSNAEIIDFHTPNHDVFYKLLRRRHPNVLKNLVINFTFILRYVPLSRRHRLFETFRNKYLNLSKRRFDSEESLKEHVNDYSIYITGSDQVFNPFVHFSNSYFLNFVKQSSIKKLSYAGSFGVSTIPDTEKARIKELLKDFDYISCREDNGLAILHDIGIHRAYFVCDPVFLLSAEEWSMIIPPRKVSEDYILVYDLNGGSNLIDIANTIKKETGVPKIICVTKNTMQHYKNTSCKYDVGPLQLLSYIKNARYVVTDSFHGTCLSLILDTKVLIYVATSSTSSRLKSLTEHLGISDQLIEDPLRFEFHAVSFSDYKGQLTDYIDQSVAFLDMALL